MSIISININLSFSAKPKFADRKFFADVIDNFFIFLRLTQVLQIDNVYIITNNLYLYYLY